MLEEQNDEDHQLLRAGEAPPRAQIQQQHYVGDLRQRILAGQIRAKQDLELDQAHISRQIKDSRCLVLTVSASPSHLFIFMLPHPSLFSPLFSL